MSARSARKKNKSLTNLSRKSLSGTRPQTRSRLQTPSKLCSWAGLITTPASLRSGESSRATAQSSRSKWSKTKSLTSRRVIALLNMSMSGTCTVSIFGRNLINYLSSFLIKGCFHMGSVVAIVNCYAKWYLT